MTDVRTIVIGVGNPVRCDDGVGLAVARAVRDRLGPDSPVTVAEEFAGGLRLAEAMSGFERAIVVDALCDDAVPPGTLVRLGFAQLGAARTVNCLHDTSLPAALSTFERLGAPVPQEVVVFGVAAADTDTLAEALTAPVAAAVPGAVQAVLDAIADGSAYEKPTRSTR